MRTLISTTLSALMLMASTSAPAAAAGPRGGSGADATLYEVTENMTVDMATGLRTAMAALKGTAKVDTPLCPQAILWKFGGKSCTITAIGRDSIDLNPYSLTFGTGTLWGEFAVVVNLEDSNPVDAPEFVVATGTFRGRMELVFADENMVPIIVITEGQLTADPNRFDVKGASFYGLFRLPFTVSKGRFEKPRRNGPAFYLTDNGKLQPVKNEEYSLGWPTVRVEVMFPGW